MRIWCARMMDVTARMAAYTSGSSFGQCSSHSSPARSIGSKSSGGGCCGTTGGYPPRNLRNMSDALDRLDLLDLDDDLSEEDRLLRDTVRRFADDRLRPHIAEWFESG